MVIKELAKPGGTWCPHCDPGHSCTIYDQRPPSCRTFTCLWLAIPQLPDHLRPDRSNVVLVTDADGHRLMAHCDRSDPMAWRRDPIYALLKQEAQSTWGTGLNVIAKAGTDMWLLTPTDDLEMGSIDSESPYRIEELPGGNVLLSILPPAREGFPMVSEPITRILKARGTSLGR
jgi:hypothetical protein